MPTPFISLTDPDGSQDSQFAYCFFADDSGINAATALAAINAAASIASGSAARLRIAVALVTSNNVRSFLQYQKNGGAWTTVTAATEVAIVDSPNVADAAATSQIITSSGTFAFAGGQFIETARNSSVMSAGSLKLYEQEWSLSFAGVNSGDIIGFRVMLTTSTTHGSGGSVITLLAVMPTANITGASSVSSSSSGGIKVAGENSFVLRLSQFGLENTGNTAVAANRIIRSVSMQLKPVNPTAMLRSKGSRINTHQVGTQGAMTNGSYDGWLAFNDIALLISMLGKAPTITTPSVAFTGNTTNGSATIASVSSFTGLVVGQTVTGAGIPGGTTILALNPGANTLLLSANASATASGVALTVTAATARDWTVLFTSGQNEVPKYFTIEDGIQGTDVARCAFACLNSLKLDLNNTKEIGVSGDIMASLLAEENVFPTGAANVAFTASTTNASTSLTAISTQLTVTGSTTNASPTITGVSSFAGLAPGQAITGAGIPASTIILATNAVLGTITLSANATATASGVTLTVATGNATGLFVGQSVTGTGIPGGATIAAVNPTANTITLSAAATAPGTGVACTASIAAIVEIPCIPASNDFIDWYVADSVSALSSAPIRQTEVYGGNFELSGRRAPVFAQRSDIPGVTNYAQTENRCFIHVDMEKLSQADAMMRQSRTWRQRYIRMFIQGPLIEGGWYHEFEIIMPYRVSNPDRGQKDAIYAGMYDLEAVNDATLGGFLQIRVRTSLAALPTSSDLPATQQPNALIAALPLVGNL